MVQTGLYQIPEQNVAVHGKYAYTLTPPSRAWLHSRCNSETPSDTHRMHAAEPATPGFPPVPLCTSESSGVSQMVLSNLRKGVPQSPFVHPRLVASPKWSFLSNLRMGFLCTSETDGVSRTVGSVKPASGFPSVPPCTPQAGGASTLTRSTEPDSAPKQASVATPMNAASRSFTRTPASDSPICRVCETAIIPPITDCTLPVSVPSTTGVVLVLPEGVPVHGWSPYPFSTRLWMVNFGYISSTLTKPRFDLSVPRGCLTVKLRIFRLLC